MTDNLAVQIAQIAMLMTAIFVLVGGIIGFKKAGSKASLIAGAVSFVLFGICVAVSMSEPKFGLIGGLVVALLLDGVFAMRLAKTKKFMPSGMMLVVLGLAQVALIFAIVSV